MKSGETSNFGANFDPSEISIAGVKTLRKNFQAIANVPSTFFHNLQIRHDAEHLKKGHF